jgi:hypothetical protein
MAGLPTHQPSATFSRSSPPARPIYVRTRLRDHVAANSGGHRRWGDRGVLLGSTVRSQQDFAVWKRTTSAEPERRNRRPYYRAFTAAL